MISSVWVIDTKFASLWDNGDGNLISPLNISLDGSNPATIHQLRIVWY